MHFFYFIFLPLPHSRIAVVVTAMASLSDIKLLALMQMQHLWPMSSIRLFGCSWCTDSRPRSVAYEAPERILLDDPLKAAVLSVADIPFPFSTTLLLQFSVNILGCKMLWTSSFFSNDLLWITFLVNSVDDYLLNICPVSSLPHCLSYWPKVRDPFKRSGNLYRCFELIFQ